MKSKDYLVNYCSCVVQSDVKTTWENVTVFKHDFIVPPNFDDFNYEYLGDKYRVGTYFKQINTYTKKVNYFKVTNCLFNEKKESLYEFDIIGTEWGCCYVKAKINVTYINENTCQLSYSHIWKKQSMKDKSCNEVFRRKVTEHWELIKEKIEKEYWNKKKELE